MYNVIIYHDLELEPWLCTRVLLRMEPWLLTQDKEDTSVFTWPIDLSDLIARDTCATDSTGITEDPLGYMVAYNNQYVMHMSSLSDS